MENKIKHLDFPCLNCIVDPVCKISCVSYKSFLNYYLIDNKIIFPVSMGVFSTLKRVERYHHAYDGILKSKGVL